MPKIFIKNKKTFLITFSLIVFMAILLIANFVADAVIKSSTSISQVSSNSCQLYFLASGKSKLKSEVLSQQQDNADLNFASFVWQNDEYYYLLIDVFKNKNDATLIQNNLKKTYNKDSEIFSVKFSSFKTSGSFSNEQAKVLNKTLNSFLTFYSSLFDIAVSLDTNILNSISAQLQINEKHHSLMALYKNFETLFDGYEEFDALKDTIKITKQVSEDLTKSAYIFKNQTYSSLIKYSYCQILNAYLNFLNY